ncbi:hypothetical protein ElyMa_002404100 [Elysia marginata]|uniref:G-protein coupled receptors family 1 profile domain-containing protein n=1 Tax=Elysia marginata TaxID=1093978 RepID=A0AAV4GGW0_9GAST|nr:hypothetical protein ElyMa_002404100 [Elysia marginata]
MPVYATGSLKRVVFVNRTDPILVMHLAPERAVAEKFVVLSGGFPLVVTTQIINVISSVFMVVGLRRQQLFRQTMTRQCRDVVREKRDGTDLDTNSPSEKSENRSGMNKITSLTNINIPSSQDNRSNSSENHQEIDKVKSTSPKAQQSSESHQTSKSSSQVTDQGRNYFETKENIQTTLPIPQKTSSLLKELLLIKTVLGLAILNVVLNSPLLAYYISSNMKSQRQQVDNVYLLSADAATFLQSLPAVLNTVVYLVLNTKFRTVVINILSFNSP